MLRDFEIDQGNKEFNGIWHSIYVSSFVTEIIFSDVDLELTVRE